MQPQSDPEPPDTLLSETGDAGAAEASGRAGALGPSRPRTLDDGEARALFDASLRERRSLWLLGALAVMGCGALDPLLCQGAFWKLWVARGITGLLLLGLWHQHPRLKGRLRRLAWLLGGALVVLSFGAIVAVTGRGQSPYLPVLYVLPPAFALVLASPRAAAICSLLDAAVGLAATWSFSEPRPAILWAVSALGLTAFAVAISSSERRRLWRQLQRGIERGRLLQRLDENALERNRSDRLALMAKLAAGVAHEVSVPLADVSTSLRVIEQELAGDANEGMLDVMHEAQEGVARIRAVVRDLRQLAKDPHLAVRVARLREFLDPALRVAALRLGDRIDVDALDEVPAVRVDPGRVAQVVVNLLANAADAMDDAKIPGRVHIGVQVQPTFVRLLIEDDGPGMPSAVLAKVFTPFFTTKGADRGTGLGLSLSRDYVTQMSGRLVAGNRPQGGACFAVELPRADPLATQTPQLAPHIH